MVCLFEKKNHLLQSNHSGLELTKHLIQWIPKNLSPGVKRPKLEAKDSHPYCDKVKNAWRCKSTPP